MKIFMYSDLHISKTSSIFPLTSKNHKYTYRQNMIIELEHKYGVIVEDINVFHIENRAVDPSYNKIVLSNVKLDIKV